MALDVGVRRVLRQLQESGFTDYRSLSWHGARELLETLSRDLPSPPVESVTDLVIQETNGDPLPIRVYRPLRADTSPPVVAFFHGGGFVMGGLETHDAMCRSLANASGAVVASVGYRLAPENSFPAAVDDAWTAVCWLAANAEEFGADGDRLAVAGDSAGGNLAAIATQLARQSGWPSIRFQVLIYPAVDARLGWQSMDTFADGYLLTRRDLEWFYDSYSPPASRLDWKVSPLLAPRMDNLPPALVITAESDPLRDEGNAYAERLRDAGVPATLMCFEGMVHGFVGMPAALVPAAERALRLSGKALAHALV